MNEVDKIIRRYRVEEYDCDMLRDIVNWMNGRNESLNQGKTVAQLVTEFLKEN